MDKIWQCMGQTYFEAWALRAQLADAQGKLKAYEAEQTAKVVRPDEPVTVSE